MKKIKDGKKANDKKQTVKDQAKSKSDTNKRRKVKLFSNLKIRVPLPSSLMLILPSLNVRASEALVNHAQNENVQPNETSSYEPHLENSDKLLESSSTQENASLLHEDKNLNEGGTEEVKALVPTPSHHLASHSHPIIHRLTNTNITTQPSISNTIDSNTQTIKTPPTHTNLTTPQSQTYVEETIQGTYGQLHVDKNGNYQFTLAPKSPAYLLLQKQEPGTDTFTVHLTDGTKLIIQVPVRGKQDSPTISGQLSGHLEEDHNVDSHGFLTTSGKVDVLDPDHGESELIPDTIHGQFGSLSINSQGYWQYTVDNSQSTIQALTNNTSLTETFTIHTKDGTPQVLQMSIGGENDNALVSGNDKGQVYEDLSTHITGKLSIRDADTGEDHFSNTDIVGSLGTLHLTNSGQWTYDLDNTNPTVQALGKGSTVTDTITVHSVDGTPHQVIITINGTNDAAVVSSATVAVDETDKAVISSGTLTSTDVDNPDNAFTPDSVTGTHGNLTIDANGHWEFTANSAFNQLNVGDKVEETFTVTSVDGTPSTIKVTISGTNDAATVSSATVAVDETDTPITASGTLTSTDVDNSDNAFTPDSITGTHGALTIDTNGHWVFTANSTFNQLNVGDKVEETFTVTSVDGTPSTVKVTINGTNDAATVSSATVAVDETDTAITTSGTLTSTDVDNPDNAFTPDSITGTHGDLTIDANGHWAFTANSAFNQLNVGNKVEETFTVASVDGTPSTIKVTINGTNDAATVSSATIAVDETDSAVTTSGTLTSTDVDNPNNTFTPDTITGTNGDLTIDANGHWVFTANSAFNQLNVGDKVEETFTVTSVDGTPSTIKVTINGTNDAATVSSATVAVDETDSAITASGTLTSTDVDNPDNTFTPDTITGTHGELTIDANGHWVFTANSAFNQLNVGDKVEEIFTVTSVDGTPSTIKVTINGTNDAATVSSATVAVDETDSAITTSGTLTSTDVDNPDNAFPPDSINGTHGDLIIDANGHWVFTANNAFNQLNVGDKVEETFTVTSVDGTPSTIKVTINGTNDVATVSSATVAVDETDTAITTSGTLTSTDVDNPNNTFTPDSITGTHGNLTIDTNGHWVFTANSAFNQLNVGDKVEETFTVTSVDGTQSTVKVTINGTNDAATISSATVAVDETDTAITTSGTLTSTDIDNPDNTFTPASITGTHGDLTINANGHWVFTANSAFNQLNVGDKVEETFTVTSVDGTPSTIKVTINGKNDAATVSSATVVVDETDTAITTSGTLTSTDVDNPDNAFTPASIAGNHGDLTIDSNGHWVFTANSAFNQLNVGDKVDETFTVASVDGTQSTIKVTINGTNDRPTISGTSSGAVIEQGLNTAGTPDATGSLTATDLDKSDTVTWAINQPQGQWGTLSIDQNGHWHYQLNNSTGGATDKLAAGEHQSESFWITATDSAGATVPHKIVIDVQGSNDKPIVSAWTQLPAGKEDQPVTIKASDLLTHASDVDSSDVLHVTNLQATHGSLTDNKDGTYTFTPDKDFNGEIRLTYDVVDGHGGSVSTQAKFDLTAAPDNAIITDAQTNADLRGVTEDRGYIDTHYQLHYDGKLNIQDPDAGEAQFDPNIGPQTYQGIGYDTKLGGHILLMRDGHYTYTLDNRNIQNLAQGEVKHDSAVIRSADGTTHTIELTVHGTNDAPTISAQSHSVTEGGSSLNGQMVGQDIDTGATLTYSAPQIDGLVVNPDGSYSFNPAHSSYQSLASGVTKTLTVPVTVTDEHNASSTQNLSITITGVNNSAVIGGVDKGDVTEGNAGKNMSPDYAQPGMAKLGQAALTADGKLDIVDPDSGESQFDTKGGAWNNSYHGKYGHLLLNSDGTWHYHASAGSVDWVGNQKTTVGTAIDQLGEHQTLTDTITIYSKDGTSHDIVITIHGSNDRPYCASEVQLNSGKEDLAQTITATELLTNTVDVDANDAGKLTIANLHADHGSIQDNHDGTYTFTPTKDYSGKVHFTYDVKDAHGGTTHTGANTTLVATPDKAIISEVTTGSVIEDGPHATHNNGTTTELANGQLQVIDPDSGEDKFQYSQFGETRIHDPFGGMLRIDSAGNWGYSVDNTTLQHLAQGQVETVTYRVHSFDGTAYDLNIDIVGTNDAPTVTKVVLSNGTEDINYQMQASQFRFTDVDTGDTLHSIAITDLPPAAQGKFVLDGHDITAGQRIAASDIAKLQFVPTPNFNGDVQFKFTVNDGHVDSQEATNTLHIDAVSDAAQFTGRDTGDVHEGHTYTAPDGSMSGGYVDDRSPDHIHGNVGKIWNDEIHTDGHLNIVDPDSGQSHAQTGTYQGTHGHVILQSNGDWSYYASIGQDATGRRIDHLGQGDSITDTVTVKSADGTTHDIHITIHGDNDRPYCSSEVQLNSGKEDLAQTITTTELLANTVDVDTNDAGQLSIANLHADHGTLVDNKDGTFTFTPDHNFNGKVHFTYDVKDAHGGVTHTGASTTLLPSNDAATLQPTLASNFVTEDHLKSGTSTNELWSGWKNLDIQDIDSPSEAKVTQIEVNGVKHTVPANFAMNLAGVHGTFNFTHSTDGHDKWSYSADNSHTEVQSLSHGDSLTDTITLITADGTRIPLTAKILGTDDHVIIDTPDALTAALGTTIEDKVTSISGTLLAHDSDSKDSVTFTAGNSVGAYGTLHVDSNGQWHYDLDHSKANALKQGETKAEGFDITAISTDGSTATKHIEVLVQGSNDKATISVTSNPDVYEDRSSTPVEIISGKLSALDPDHDQSAFSTDVGKRHDPFNSGVHGGLHISKDGSWTYTVNNSQIQQLAAGQEEHAQYNVHTVGGDYHVIDIKIVGTNDIPTVSATTLAHGTEDTHYQMQASQFGFTDVDTGDTLHSIAITDLPPATQGKFVLDGNDITAGQSIATADIAKLQFVPATDFNGDVQFKFTVNDGHASSAEATNTLHIDAVGDAATISGVDTGSVTEDRNVHPSVQGNYSNKLEAQGHLTAIDPDAGESGFDYHTLISVPSHPNWAPYQSALGGELEIDQQGRWHYYIDNRKPEVQSLGAGETLTDTVTVHSKDGTTHDITLTIHGTNDDPVVSADVQLSAGREDTTHIITSTDLLTHASDVDKNDLGQLSVTHLSVDHGSILDNGDGTFTLIPEPDYNGQLHFQYQVNDAHGGSAPASASMSVLAVNDRPDVQPISDRVKEDATNHHSVNLLTGATDKEGDSLSISHIGYSVDGSTQTGNVPDGFALGADGHSLVIDATHSAFQHLAAGQTQQVVVNYIVGDGHGGQTPQTATFTIEGTDDKAVLTSNVIQMTESEALKSKTSVYQGNLQLTDPDTGDHTQFAFSGRYMGQGYAPGSLYIWPDGSYEFRMESATNRHADDLVDSLHKGESLEFPYQIRTSDGQRLNIIVKVTGEDDNARITVGQYSSLDNHANEDNIAPGGTHNQVWSGGNLHVIDPDHGQAGFVTQSFDTPEGGHFSINVRGGWQYTIDNAKLQHLGEGQSYQKTFTVESIDGTAQQTITVTVHGTNDTPVVTSSISLSQGVEDTPITLKAEDLLAHASDVDDHSQLRVHNLSVDHGQVVDNLDGTFNFTPEKDYHGQVQFTYDVKDEHGASVSTSATMSLSAVNDAATFSGDSASLVEDANLQHNTHLAGSPTIRDALFCRGSLVISDVDGQGEAALDFNGQQYLNHDGNYGHFIVSSNGTWAYVADNDNQQIQDLDNGQTLTDSVEVTSKDGTKHSITVTINGTTDKPVLHSLSDSGVQHSGPIEGNLLSGIGTNEGASGAATDTDSNAHLVLQDIQVKDPVSGYVTVTPGHPHTMVGIGTLAIEANGHYTFTPEAGFTGTVPSMVYRVGDDGGNLRGDSSQNRLTIEVTPPAQHAPTATPQTVTSDEDQTHTFTTSEFGYSDADGDALNHITITQLPTKGTLMLNGVLVTTNQQISKADLDAGHLTFTPIHDQNGANYANIGFTANDGHQDSTNATIILNVNAVNDDPTVGSSFKSSPEDTPMRFTKADFKYSDVDGDPLSHITITNVAHGTLSLNGHSVSVGDDVSAADVSSLVFTPTLNYSSAGLNGLGAVQFTANDGHTDSKEGSIFINIAPVDDPATFTGDSTGQAQEDLHTQTTGVLNAIDPDGTQGFITVQGGAGIVGSKGYGHAHIDSNGHWTYNLYNNHAIVQQLKQGQTDTETITVQAKDGTTHDIVITITGTNDAPTVSEHIPGSSHSVNEDTNPNARGQLDINDIDGDAVSVTVDPSQSAQFGSVQFDSQTNTWAYHLNNANPQVDALNDGDTLTDRFTLLVDDGHGGQVSKEIVMTINGHTDPVPYTPPTISVTVDTRNAHHVTAGITASTVQAYAHSIGQFARTVSGHHEVEGHGQSEIYIVQGSLHDEAELKSGNDILYIGGRLTDEEIEGGSGRDTLILGAYNRNNAPRLHSDKIGNMEIESIENIILGDGTVLKGHLPPNFPLATHDHYEVPVNIQAHLSSSDESVSSIRLTHLQQGLTLQSNGHNINANQDGSYTVPANGHLVVISTHPISSGHHYFETEVTTHNSVTGITAVTTEDLQGHIQTHVNPPPPPPPVQHDEPDLSPSDSVQDFTVTLDDPSSTDTPWENHAQVSHERPVGAAAYLDALGIQPNTSPTSGQDQPADMDIVLAQVDQQHVVDYDQAHLDMSDALEHHDAANNQDDEHHHHNDVDGLPDIDPNN